MAKSDAGVLTRADQAHTVFVAQRALVVIEVCMTLGDCEKVHSGGKSILPY